MEDVNPWVRRAAVIAALSPVASSLWRLPLMFGVSMGMDDEFMASMMGHPFWLRCGYLVLLGVLSDGSAYLTFGLVRSWGREFPGWIPGLGGRAVNTWFAASLAASGAAVVTWVTVTMAVSAPDNLGVVAGGWGVLMLACYAPLLLWGPLLLVVTLDYVRRGHARARQARPVPFDA